MINIDRYGDSLGRFIFRLIRFSCISCLVTIILGVLIYLHERWGIIMILLNVIIGNIPSILIGVFLYNYKNISYLRMNWSVGVIVPVVQCVILEIARLVYTEVVNQNNCLASEEFIIDNNITWYFIIALAFIFSQSVSLFVAYKYNQLMKKYIN